ncbi:type II toxin-antitoxin system prevent-host-death family antitoxin [Vineibacter terrae]|uniref:type II toxin-antitoxin system prevent-host-death family antitoxin n=1 Tax=Vineibacter terrae TaxID=2586908 RepID=UPI002F421BF0
MRITELRGLHGSDNGRRVQRKFGEFQHQAQREPVEITRHGRRELVLMSADHYDWLVAPLRPRALSSFSRSLTSDPAAIQSA